MTATCACGKRITEKGNRIIRKGLPKKSGGIGLHTTGITRRTMKRNVQTIRVRLASGQVKRMKVCASCIKKGRFEKA